MEYTCKYFKIYQTYSLKDIGTPEVSRNSMRRRRNQEWAVALENAPSEANFCTTTQLIGITSTNSYQSIEN